MPRVFTKLRSAISVGLILWCAGAGCMLVSYAHAGSMNGMAAPNVSSAGAGWGGTSASAGTHGCCKARHSTAHSVPSLSHHPSQTVSANKSEGLELTEVPDQSDAMSCCPLTSGTIVVAGRQRISNEDAAISKIIGAFAKIPAGPTAVPTYARTLPHESQTHLRLCVFLI